MGGNTASLGAVLSREPVKGDERRIEVTFVNFVKHDDLPPLDVPLVAQVTEVVKVARPAEDRYVLCLGVEGYVRGLVVAHDRRPLCAVK